MTFAVVATIITVAIIVVARVILPRLLAWRGVFMQRTKFGLALVFDSEDADGTPVRLLNVNGTYQSVSYVSDDLWCELVCVYHRTFADVLAKGPAPRRAVVIGGGGYSFPKYLLTHDDEIRVDVVEIDPAITALARRFFFLDRLEGEAGDRLGLVTGDGWSFLIESPEPYDLVVNDAFSGNRPLGPLKTEEGARAIHEHLSEQGIYLANIRSKLDAPHAGSLVSTLDAFAREFSHVYMIPECPEEPGRLGNNSMVASDMELPIGHEWDGELQF